MKPIIKIASTTTPDGSELVLSKHDRDYTFTVNREKLMSSRKHESECELARLGCERIKDWRNPAVLIGGLGMGYTLRTALDLLEGAMATVEVAELLPAVVRWNRDIIGDLAGHPLRDKRVVVRVDDVFKVLKKSPNTYDSIMLDIDNGTSAITDSNNDRLYTRAGINAIIGALHLKGSVSFWAADCDKRFKRLLNSCGLYAHFFRAPSHAGGKNRPHCIWVASRSKFSLPPLPEIPERGRGKRREVPSVLSPAPEKQWRHGEALPPSNKNPVDPVNPV
ncbi:hypothetical protein ACFLS1_11720 [Verrucomicrobiota bacterium]